MVMQKKAMRPNKRPPLQPQTEVPAHRRALVRARDSRDVPHDARYASGWPILAPGAI